MSDDVEPNRAAASIARTGLLGDIFFSGSGPSAHLAPFHPLLLGGIYRIFGIETPTSLFIQSLVAILMFSLITASLPSITDRAGLTPEVGILAAVILVILPFNLYSETTGTWESAEAALSLLIMLYAFIILHDRQWSDMRLIAGTGVLAGLVAMLSPVLLCAGALMMLVEILTQKKRRMRVIQGCGAIVILAAVTLSPWALRNYWALGAPVPTRSNLGLELFMGNNDSATGVLSNQNQQVIEFYQKNHPFNSADEQAHYREMGELGYMKGKQDRALRWINEHPLRFASLTVKRFLLFLFTGIEMWPPGTSARSLKFLVFLILGVGALGGVVCLSVIRNPFRWLFLASLIGPAVPYAITSVAFRYRYPIYPLTVLLTTVVLQSSLGKIRSWAGR